MNWQEKVLNWRQLAETAAVRPATRQAEEETFSCPLCQDRGLLLRDGVAYRCSCQQQKFLEQRFSSARLSYQLRKNTLTSFQLHYYSDRHQVPDRQMTYRQAAEQALQAAREFVDEYPRNPHRRGLLFSGPVGAGKTFLASAVANALVTGGVRVLFVVVPDLLDEIKGTYNQGSRYTELELLDAARGVEVLILDDLGAHNYTPWTVNKLYSILNYRLNEQLPTIITTNLSLEELEEYLGERTTSRIIQMCRVYRLFVQQDIRHLVPVS